MSAEDTLDKWFAGPKEQSKVSNPREFLKELPPTSLQDRRDYGTSIELGSQRGTKFELKYPSWGLYPRHELAGLLTMIRIAFIGQAMATQEANKTKIPAIIMPEAEKQKAMLREKAYQDFLNKKNI